MSSCALARRDAGQLAGVRSRWQPEEWGRSIRSSRGGGLPRGQSLTGLDAAGWCSVRWLRPRLSCHRPANSERAVWIDTAGPVVGAFLDDGPFLVQPRSRKDPLRGGPEELLRCGGFALVVLLVWDGARGHGARFGLTRAVREGGAGVSVAITPHPSLAKLRMESKIIPHSYRGTHGPFNDPVEVQHATIKVRARAAGVEPLPAEITGPVSLPHVVRLSWSPSGGPSRYSLADLSPALPRSQLASSRRSAWGVGMWWTPAAIGRRAQIVISRARRWKVLQYGLGLSNVHCGIGRGAVVSRDQRCRILREHCCLAGRSATAADRCTLRCSLLDCCYYWRAGFPFPGLPRFPRPPVPVFPVPSSQFPVRLPPACSPFASLTPHSPVLLDGIGVDSMRRACGYSRGESVEVRLGADGFYVRLWKLCAPA
jgi:hypothetical protein